MAVIQFPGREKEDEAITGRITMKECSQESFYSWSLNDYYFMSGVRALSEALITSGCEIRFSFFCMSGHSLISLIEQPLFRKLQNTVIITFPLLMPLTAFWLAVNSPYDVKIIQATVNVEHQLPL